MTSYIIYDILKPSVFCKIWRRGALNFISGGAWMVLIQLCVTSPKSEHRRISGLLFGQERLEGVQIFLGLGTHLFVKAPRPVDNEVIFSVFESSCHLLLPV